MDFDLTEEQRLIKETAATFVTKEVSRVPTGWTATLSIRASWSVVSVK